MSKNPRRGRQARNFTANVPKILDLKSSSEQIFFRKLSLGAPVSTICRVAHWLKQVLRSVLELFKVHPARVIKYNPLKIAGGLWNTRTLSNK